jgi:hypothetical protein
MHSSHTGSSSRTGSQSVIWRRAQRSAGGQRLDGLQIEAAALLHGRKLKEGLRLLSHLLLEEDEPPKLGALKALAAQFAPRTFAISVPYSSLERDFLAKETAAPKAPQRRYLRAETGNRRPPRARNGRKNGPSACELFTAGFVRLGGGRTRARTWDPLIKIQRHSTNAYPSSPVTLAGAVQRLRVRVPSGPCLSTNDSSRSCEPLGAGSMHLARTH